MCTFASIVYKLFLKPFLFLLDPERAHYFTASLFKHGLKTPLIGALIKKLYLFENKSLERNILGLKFKNPVGLAAGFDKNADLYQDFQHLGFGFIEVGTVTPLAQAGNPKPRLFRLPEDEALINRMGFNNEGLEAMIARLKAGKADLIIGGNIGKNKATPNEEAASDYEKCFRALHPYVDYFTVNVSSPNTPNLRALQDKEPLKALLSGLKTLNVAFEVQRPILLKIAPDLTNEQLDDIVEIVEATGIEGIVATNTTIERKFLRSANQKEQGGLSGKPVRQRSTEVIRYLRSKTKAVIIGVGGIYEAADAIEKLDAGADLLQVYSGLVYEGPSLIKSIKKALVDYGSKTD